MKIKIVEAGPYSGDLRVVFDNPQWHTTREGKRALRILRLHVRGGYERHGSTFVLHGGAGVQALNTTAKCQAEMDRLANVVMRFSFGPISVRSADGKTLRNLAQVRSAQKAGLSVVGERTVTSNLAFIGEDYDVLRARTNFPVSMRFGRAGEHVAIIGSQLKASDREADPWLLAEVLRDKLEELVK